jgi:hypothetical protein
MFSIQPAINKAGLLTFTPATGFNGTALVTVIAQDDGGSPFRRSKTLSKW